MPAERRWLFSQDQGSTYLLCRLTMYESSSLCYVTKHEVFVPFFFSFFFLSLWSTKISSKATGDVTSRLWRLKAQRFHIFRNICVIIVNTNTLKMHSYRRQRSCSFLFFEESDFRTISLSAPVWLSSVCAYKRLEDGNKSQFEQIHCTVTYFIVLFLEGNKKELFLLFLSVFCSFEQIALQCFYIQ